MSDNATALRLPLIDGDRQPADVTNDVCRPLEGRPSGLWWLGITLSSSALVLGVVAVTYMLRTGIGSWGLNRTVGWGFDITNFVFWIGIGHAGTLISAVLFLFRQRWRTAVNRSAEAMTIFAVMCAGLFPLIHMGRPWLAYWVFPYPNTRGPLWINFRSALCWDVFAVSTYFLISLGFWYVGMVPDLATLRDRTRAGLKKKLFGWFSLGWNGSTRTWARYETVYMLLAGLATPLVFSVHTIVSFDFATSIIPGWHTTIFPPYFVAGAIFSGLAMVLTAMCKLIIGMGGVVATAYATEFFIAWYSGNEYERFAFMNRALGPFAWTYWTMVTCNVVTPQLFWFRKIRSNLVVVFILSIFINVGMWFERFVIIVTSLHRDFLPSSWQSYVPTKIEVATLIGSFGLFFTLFLLFCRFLPVISMGEIKGVLSYGRSREGDRT
jgi:molybdopterin-containing oxidoreductase family membrane subunit